jgi:hypothetical protein
MHLDKTNDFLYTPIVAKYMIIKEEIWKSTSDRYT